MKICDIILLVLRTESGSYHARDGLKRDVGYAVLLTQILMKLLTETERNVTILLQKCFEYVIKMLYKRKRIFLDK